MKNSDVAEVEEQSEPEFIYNADTISTAVYGGIVVGFIFYK